MECDQKDLVLSEIQTLIISQLHEKAFMPFVCLVSFLFSFLKKYNPFIQHFYLTDLRNHSCPCPSIIQMCLAEHLVWLSVWSVSHTEHVLQCIVALCKSTPPPHIMIESANVAAVEISMCCTLNHGFLQVDWQEQSGWLMFTAPNHQAYN